MSTTKPNAFMNRLHQRGVTLVELMVTLLIGSIAVLVIQQVMAVFEGQKRTTSGGSDAQVNGAIALFAIERDIKQAGYGLFSGEGTYCPQGVNIYFDGSTISNAGVLMPLAVRDGGPGNPDEIEVVSSNSAFPAIPVKIVGTGATFKVKSRVGLEKVNAPPKPGSKFMVAGKDADKPCTLMQVSAPPAFDGTAWDIAHAANPDSPFNSPSPAASFPGNYPTYAVNDLLINMGGFERKRYVVQMPCARLTEVDPLTAAPPYVCGQAGLTPLADQIVDLQAQYGITNVGSNQIVQWCDATTASACGDWSNPTSTDFPRIRAVRIAIVSRSAQWERDTVSPASLTLWPAGDPGDAPPVLNLAAADQHYRYRVFTTIVPIRNVIWGGQ